jgi:hypothetical protein
MTTESTRTSVLTRMVCVAARLAGAALAEVLASAMRDSKRDHSGWRRGPAKGVVDGTALDVDVGDEPVTSCPARGAAGAAYSPTANSITAARSAMARFI